MAQIAKETAVSGNVQGIRGSVLEIQGCVRTDVWQGGRELTVLMPRVRLLTDKLR